jgi:magnesium chelatase subunit D
VLNVRLKKFWGRLNRRLEATIMQSSNESDTSAAWEDALIAAALLAVDPATLGGASLRAMPGPARDAWLTQFRAWLPAMIPWRRIPSHVTDNRLLGGLDLAATLAANRPVAERGILADADGGVVVLTMAERVSANVAARLTAVMDTGEVVLARDGIELRHATKFAVVMLDEGLDDSERAPVALQDRLAFQLDLSRMTLRDITTETLIDVEQINMARALLPNARANEEQLKVLCVTAQVLGISSIRASMAALRVACVSAALDGRELVDDDDVALAARLVLAPRATQMPAMEEDESEAEDREESDPQEQQAEPESDSASDENQDDRELEQPNEQKLEDKVLEAAKAAIPADLLSQLLANGANTARGGSSGRMGANRQSGKRGRPLGARRGMPRAGARLNVIETLRAAAPWQRLRAAEAMMQSENTMQKIYVRQEDFHVTRFKERRDTTVIFVVDASGSAALNRLAEAKGAVELLLADCYVRRDQVALISFRGKKAELLLPPTRSLVRAKRGLGWLPGGGGTPLATAIDAAVQLADSVARRGDTPSIVFLTDGRTNIARDGSPGRPAAEADALASARQLRAQRFSAVFVDTSTQPAPQAAQIAKEMGAIYQPLPYANASTISDVIREKALAK